MNKISKSKNKNKVWREDEKRFKFQIISSDKIMNLQSKFEFLEVFVLFHNMR